MKGLTPQQNDALAVLKNTNPVIVEWLTDWYNEELRRLPQALNNTAVAQGRCQVLGELLDALNKSPEYAAQAKTSSRTFDNAYR